MPHTEHLLDFQRIEYNKLVYGTFNFFVEMIAELPGFETNENKHFSIFDVRDFEKAFF